MVCTVHFSLILAVDVEGGTAHPRLNLPRGPQTFIGTADYLKGQEP
jgi:hypothetical protein